MNLVDSSGWLEYFADGKKADIFGAPLNDTKHLIVPTICLFEVFKVILRERDENSALQAIAVMQQGHTVELTPEIAIQAAKNSLDYKLPLADSIILTTAQAYGGIIWTQEADLKDIKGVKYIPKL